MRKALTTGIGILTLMTLLSSACVSSPEQAVQDVKPTNAPNTNLRADENVLLFPTNAQFDSQTQQWQVQVHGWVFEPEKDSAWRNSTIAALKLSLDIEAGTPEAKRFEERIGMFLVDNKDEKNIAVQVGDKTFPAPMTEGNGHFEFNVHLPTATNPCPHWLALKVITPTNDKRSFTGGAQCIQDHGISVISDIDDTVKQSNVLDKKALMKNTFLKEFTAVPGMADVYQHWHAQGAVFHYVSSSPWQLYPALAKFFTRSGLPKGSMHLKLFRLKDSSFFNMFDSPEEGKIPAITKLLEAYPQRQFILVGDSGEKDPEIYATIAQRYPKQIKAIYIHELSDSKLRLNALYKDLTHTRWLGFKDAKQILPHYAQH
jgi:phosphatidate phosphatase APP1